MLMLAMSRFLNLFLHNYPHTSVLTCLGSARVLGKRIDDNSYDSDDGCDINDDDGNDDDGSGDDDMFMVMELMMLLLTTF